MSTQWHTILFTVIVKIANDELLFGTKTLNEWCLKETISQSSCYVVAGRYMVTDSLSIVSIQPITK